MRTLVARWALTAVLALSFAGSSAAAQEALPLFSNAFQDRVVLQRETPIALWGTATPGETVSVTMADTTVEASVSAEGRWRAHLPPQPAGGPHTLRARSTSGATQTLTDVLVGDVFLCSGQSNMALPVRRTLNERAEISGAANERIRMMTVPQASSATPRDTLSAPAAWEEAHPETVPEWSAACYYFARELQAHVDVPFGLINSSWGGSKISAWMSREALSNIDGYGKPLRLLRRYADDARAGQQAFGAQWETWWRGAVGDVAEDSTPDAAPWQPQAGADWPSAPEGLGNWKGWGVPGLRDFNGMLWLRSTVDLTAARARREATLSLGGVDEVDQTWINGEVLGNTFGYGTPRTYPVPDSLLREGENVVVTNVLNTYGSGGLVGDPAARALLLDNGDRLALEEWRYRKVPPEIGLPPRTPWESVGGLSTIHNAMIAPLHEHDIRGVVWYQGESDTGAPEQYQHKLETLMAQWRNSFGGDLPVLVVQLANYGMPATTPSESGWAEVREAQRRATRQDPRAGLAVTIDIGSPYDVHPANKQEVGRRLTRAARSIIYGAELTPSGPVPTRATRTGEQVSVTFDDVAGSLIAYGADDPIGFQLCEAERGSCRYAEAEIDGDRVLLQATGQEVARVRYCWADSPTCTLYDEARLPAGPFEIEVSNDP